jgi:hypothetical protein
VIRVHPDMARHLDADERDGIERLQALVGKRIAVEAVAGFAREQYELGYRSP